MPYARIDARFDDHPSHSEYDLDVMGLIACAITYSNRHLTDGKIPRSWVSKRFPKFGKKAAMRLVEDGKWRLDQSGDFEIVDYLEHNPSRASVLKARETSSAAKSEAGRKGGKASAETRRIAYRKVGVARLNGATFYPTPEESNVRHEQFQTDSQAEGKQRASSLLKQNEAEGKQPASSEKLGEGTSGNYANNGSGSSQARNGTTRALKISQNKKEEIPDTLEEGGVGGGTFALVAPTPPPPAKATRLSADWQPKPETIERFRIELGVDATALVPEFVDYWIAAPGSKGVKLDWEATFRNWIRRAHERGQVPRYVAPKPRQTHALNPFTGELEPLLVEEPQPDEDRPYDSASAIRIAPVARSGPSSKPVDADCGAGTGPLTLFGGAERPPGPPDAPEGILGAASGGRRRA